MPGQQAIELRPHREQRPTINAAALMVAYQERMDSERLCAVANSLNVSGTALKRLRVGWIEEKQALSFPMADAAGRIIGIRTRTMAGSKKAIFGSRQGLFYDPLDRCYRPHLWICEGPTDCAALLTIGLCAIGRPSCVGQEGMLTGLLRRRQPCRVTIVRDDDRAKPSAWRANQQGLERLLERIDGRWPVDVVLPPPPHKDVREWIAHGATALELRKLLT